MSKEEFSEQKDLPFPDHLTDLTINLAKIDHYESGIEEDERISERLEEWEYGEKDPEQKYWDDCATWNERHSYDDEGW